MSSATLGDHVAAFKSREKLVVDGGCAEGRSEEVAADRAGAVAVATVIEGVKDSGAKTGSGERAVGCDGQGFLASPPLAGDLDRVGAQRALLRGVYRGDYLFTALGLLEPGRPRAIIPKFGTCRSRRHRQGLDAP